MNVQDAKKIQIPEGEVRAIHDKDNRLLWGRLEYGTKYEGDAWQQTYTGKNLWGGFGTFSKTISGLNFSTQNDFITVSGTATSRNYSIYGAEANQNGIYVVSQPGTYYLSSKEPLPAGVTVQAVGTDGTTIRSGAGSFTISQQTNVVIRLMVESGTVIANTLTVYPQLEAGSTATPYEPYVGGVPAPNPDYPQDVKAVEGPQTITVRGKNKFSFNAGDATVGGDVSQTHTDNLVHMVATGTTGAQYYRVTLPGFDSSKTYRFSCKSKKIVKGTDGQPRLRVALYISNNGGSSWVYNNVVQETDPVQGQTYDLAMTFTGYKDYRFYFYNNSNTPVTIGEETEYWDIQVEEGSTTTTFEAFQAKTVSTDLRGVNLMPMSSADMSVNRVNNYNNVFSAGTYTLSYDLDSFALGNNNSFNIYAQFRNSSDGSVLDARFINVSSSTTTGRKTYTFTLPADTSAAYPSNIRIPQTQWDDGARAVLSNIQIEPGDNASTYQPYHVPYKLAKAGAYSDYFYKDGSDWKLRKQVGEVTFNGTETWVSSTTTTSGMNRFRSDVADIKQSLLAVGSSNRFIPAVNDTYYSNGISGSTSRKVIFIRYDDVIGTMNASQVQAWVASNNITAYYILDVPTDTTVTDAALITKLDTIHNWLNRYGYHADVVGDLPIVINQESL